MAENVRSIIVVLYMSPFILFTITCLCRLSCFGEGKKEKTLAIIKPDGVYNNYSDKIKNKIIDSGFSIMKEMKIHLDEDRVRSFYAEHSSKSFFSSLVNYMTRYVYVNSHFKFDLLVINLQHQCLDIQSKNTNNFFIRG